MSSTLRTERRTCCTYHCGGCGEHFSSSEAFGAHRSGSYSEGRYCLPPSSVNTLTIKADGATCKIGHPEQSHVTVWQTVRAAKTPAPWVKVTMRPPVASTAYRQADRAPDPHTQHVGS